jgi:hypothetical protein
MANEVGKSIYPDLPRGNTEYDATQVVHMASLDTTKMDNILGIKIKTMAETTKDVLEDFKNRGW